MKATDLILVAAVGVGVFALMRAMQSGGSAGWVMTTQGGEKVPLTKDGNGYWRTPGGGYFV